MKKRLLSLLLLTLLLAACAKDAAPAWAADPAQPAELVDGTLEDALALAAYCSGLELGAL